MLKLKHAEALLRSVLYRGGNAWSFYLKGEVWAEDRKRLLRVWVPTVGH